jgi:hypothetical protein
MQLHKDNLKYMSLPLTPNEQQVMLNKLTEMLSRIVSIKIHIIWLTKLRINPRKKNQVNIFLYYKEQQVSIEMFG